MGRQVFAPEGHPAQLSPLPEQWPGGAQPAQGAASCLNGIEMETANDSAAAQEAGCSCKLEGKGPSWRHNLVLSPGCRALHANKACLHAAR